MADGALRGVFGGTFDPVHIGHLRTVLDLQSALGIETIHLVPNSQPPHRATPVASGEQRYQLLLKACRGHDGLYVDRRELERDGASYMVDTLTSLKADYPESHLCLIIGTDAYRQFCSWHRWESILELAHLVVMQRAGEAVANNPSLDQQVVRDPTMLRQQSAGLVFHQQVTQLEISSTKLREMLKNSRSVEYLVPEVVRQEIENMYKG